MIRLSDTRMRLLPQRYALTVLHSILDGLAVAFTRWSEVEECAGPNLTQQWENLLRNRRSEAAAYRSNAEAVLEKCDMASQLLASIMDFHKHRIAGQQEQIAREQNERVYRLTKFTVDDSITVRVITAISLFFLSFATVAVSTVIRMDGLRTDLAAGNHRNAAVLSRPRHSQARRVTFILDLHLVLAIADWWNLRILAMADLSEEEREARQRAEGGGSLLVEEALCEAAMTGNAR